MRASKVVPYGRVAQIMGAVTAAGFKKVALVTEPARSRRGLGVNDQPIESGLYASAAMHAALLALVFGFAFAPKFEDASESIPVETVSRTSSTKS